MKLPTTLSTLATLHLTHTALAASSSPPTHILANPPPSDNPSHNRIPTSAESAVLGRRILALTPLATLSTVFPADTDDAAAGTQERRPPGLGGVPIGLMDYIADCDPTSAGNPTVLAIGIATSFKNVAAGSNMSISVDWAPPYPPRKRIEGAAAGVFARLRGWWSGSSSSSSEAHTHKRDPVPYSAANLPRFSLLGYLEPILPADDADSATTAAAADALQACFLASHPDARYWLPGNRIHASAWARLVVTQVYWIGGFGDRAYIGWIPVDEWRNVTREEWEGVRLPGEKPGWEEWSLFGAGEVEL